MTSNRVVSSTLKKYYIFQTGIQVLFWVPIFYAYQIQKGLTPAEYFTIQSLYYWIFCFLEVPTGWLADRISYRRSMIIAALIMALSSLSAVLWVSYTGFLVHFTLVAAARAFTSGAANAYLYEFLQEHSIDDDYKRAEGRARSVSLGLRVIGWSAAGYLFSIEASIPYWMTIFACLMAALAALTMPKLVADSSQSVDHSPPAGENSTSKGHQEKWGLFGFFKYIFKQKKLFYAMLTGVGIFVMTRMSMVNLFQPILSSKGLDASSFGWIMALITVFEGLGADRAHLLKTKLSDLKAIGICTLLAAIFLSLISLTDQFLTVVFFCIFSVMAGISYPLIRQQVNEQITDNSSRATLLSAESILHRVFMGTAAMSCAWAVKTEALNWFIPTASAFCVLIVLFGTIRLKRTS